MSTTSDGKRTRRLVGGLLLIAAACVHRATLHEQIVRFFGEASDPVGDTAVDPRVPNPPDLVSAAVRVTDESVTFSVRFAPGTFDSATTGVNFDLDTDLDITTGVRLPSSGLGVDYVLGLGAFSGTDAVVSRAAGGKNCEASTDPCYYTPVAHWRATYRGDGIDGTVPRAAFERFDGRLNFRLVAYVRPGGGRNTITTDHMPNPPSQTVKVR